MWPTLPISGYSVHGLRKQVVVVLRKPRVWWIWNIIDEIYDGDRDCTNLMAIYPFYVPSPHEYISSPRECFENLISTEKDCKGPVSTFSTASCVWYRPQPLAVYWWSLMVCNHPFPPSTHLSQKPKMGKNSRVWNHGLYKVWPPASKLVNKPTRGPTL